MHRFAAVAVLDPRGWLLAQERGDDALHEPGRWGYPGGDLESGEDFRTAAVRELQEEAGLVVDPAGLGSLGTHRFASDFCGEVDEFELFAVRTDVGDRDVVCHEGRQMVFVDPDVLSTRPLHRATVLTLPAVLTWSDAHPPETSARRFAGTMLVDRRGWILMQERDEHPRIDPEKWGLSGGHLEPGETPLEGALRELEEETGVVLGPADVHEVGAFAVDHRESYGTWDRMWVWAAAVDLTDADIDCREGRQIVFVDPATVPGLPLTRGAEEIVPAFLRSPLYASMAP